MKTWIQLSPFGQFYHRLGKQYLSQETLKACVKKTQTWRFRFGFTKIPIYVGHPDDAYFQQFPEHMNMTVYGYVRRFCLKDNGLWIQVDWTESGRELMDNGRYRYVSPRWEMEEVNDHFVPKKLLSVGLTNTPNLPVEPIYKSNNTQGCPVQSVQKRSEKVAILNFVQKVYQRMKATGESYPEAWNAVFKKNNI